MSVTDHQYMDAAARLALRGQGGAEPNPLVGCVIVQPGDGVVGWGYHRQCGGPHAEIHALRRAAGRAAGATVYVTLEPCNHTGRTGPCADALIDAGVRRVVYACGDPGPDSGGGAERLRSAGIAVEQLDGCRAAVEVTRPFVRRIRTGLPWIVAKWAQTLDGRVATYTGESKWISSRASRHLVHAKRGRVDAILTGIGTVRTDDPQLNARSVRVRRVAKRVVIDPALDTPLDSRLVATARTLPTLIVGDAAEHAERAALLGERGVVVVPVATTHGHLNLETALRELVARHEISTVLTEAGPGLLGRLFAQRLVNEAWVFIAPLLLSDEQALPCVRGLTVERLTDGHRLDLWNVRRRGDDVVLRYGVAGAA